MSEKGDSPQQQGCSPMAGVSDGHAECLGCKIDAKRMRMSSRWAREAEARGASEVTGGRCEGERMTIDRLRALGLVWFLLAANALGTYVSLYDFSFFLAVFGPSRDDSAQIAIYLNHAGLDALVIILFLVALVTRGIWQELLRSRQWPAVASGAVGIAGCVFVLCAGQFSVPALCYAGSVLMAVALTVSLLAVGVRIPRLPLKRVVLLAFAAGCAYAAWKVAALFLPAVNTVLPFISFASMAVATVFFPKAGDEAGQQPSARVSDSVHKRCIYTFFVTGCFICLITAIYPHLMGSPEMGSVQFSEQIITYALVLFFCACCIAYTYVTSIERRYLSSLFVIASTFSIISFFIALIFIYFDQSRSGMGFLTASSKTVIFVMLAFAGYYAVLFSAHAASALALFAVLTRALPQMIVNGVVKQIGFSVYTGQPELLVPITACIAVLVSLAMFGAIATDIVLYKELLPYEAAEYVESLCAAASRDRGLTHREQEVLVQLYRGNSVKAIAESLYLAPSTVQTHMRSLYKKMGVHSRQELVDLCNEFTP